jgi:hypothetical protein
VASPTVVPNVAIYHGDTCVFPTYTFKTDGTPNDLSAWTFTAQWRMTRTSTDALDMTVDSSAAATGSITVSLSAAQTANIWSAGVWDLSGVRGSEVRTFVTGATTYQSDVTRG